MIHIVWLRHELRLVDNPALYAAAERGASVIPVFIYDDTDDDLPGAASKWWRHHGLVALRELFRERDVPLLVKTGAAHKLLPELAARHNATAVFWSRAYDPVGARQDAKTARTLRDAGVATRIFSSANLLSNPQEILNKSGQPYKVFTPYWKHAAASPVAAPLPAPARLTSIARADDEGDIDALNLLPRKDWTGGLEDAWTPGETGALERLDCFLDAAVARYADERDYPAEESVSRLSPHLHYGEISPRVIVDALDRHSMANSGPGLERHIAAFKRQLYWREFAAYLLAHFPTLPQQPMRPEFTRFPWREDGAQLRAWQRGQTGYPIVDAGMRQLWATGWMHNRVRMVAGSFLVKQLLLPWQSGAAWFWDTLVDADAANNTLGWQWVAGCGPDAAPYFRIFNPTLQSERFDASGAYIRRWIPELAALDTRGLHAPWNAPPSALDAAGIVLGKDYPAPLVDHQMARNRALEAFAVVKAGK